MPKTAPAPTPSIRAPNRRGLRAALALEAGAYLLGAMLLVLGLTVLVRGELQRARAAEQWPDSHLWSEQAKARYLEAPAVGELALVGMLRVPSLDLEVPVYDSASALKLDRGAGIIDGMAYPHESGHIGIAGHRDGYFRAFKDIRLGATLELESFDGPKYFIVDDLRVIDPTEIAYLEETDGPRLTIVTCYPFYFAGSAPQRFLVRAAPLKAGASSGTRDTGEAP